MHTDQLLRAVIERPDEDAARIAYGEALVAAGDPRGALVLLQLRPGAGPTTTTAERVAALIEELRAVWEEAFGEDAGELAFERGLPCAAELWIARTGDDPLFALDLAPILHIKLRYDEDAIEPAEAARCFAADARTSRIRSLDLTWEEWGDDAIRSLLGADLTELRTLFVGDRDGQTYAAEAMVGNDTLRALTALEVSGDSYARFEDGLALLLASPHARSLRRLSLPNCSLEAHAAEMLAGASHLEHLEALDLTGGSNTTNAIGDEGLRVLARSPSLKNLTRLSLGHNRVTDRGLAALAEPNALPGLQALALNGCQIADAALAAVVQARRLDELYIGGCHGIHDSGVIAVARSVHARHLRRLNVSGTCVGEAGVRALIASPIEHLDYLGIEVEPALRGLLAERFGEAALVARPAAGVAIPSTPR